MTDPASPLPPITVPAHPATVDPLGDNAPPHDLVHRGPAATGAHIPSRAQTEHTYRMLAAKVLTDPRAWDTLNGCCEKVVQTKLYGHKEASTVMIAAIKGMAMGMDFMRALAAVKVIHGTPTIRGPQALALIRERCPGASLDCAESSPDRCVWKVQRPGDRERVFTRNLDDVPQKQRSRNDKWGEYPKRMLKWDCFSEAAQEVFGDVLEGCYIYEEIVGARTSDSSEDSATVPAPTRPLPQERSGFSNLLSEYAKGRVALYGGSVEEIRTATYHQLAQEVDCNPKTPTAAQVDKMAQALERLTADQLARMDEEGQTGHEE